MTRAAWMDNTAGDWLDQWLRRCDPDINERTEPSVNTPNLNPNPYPTSTYTDKDNNPMNINNSFPSKWLKSGDITDDTDMVLTIKRVDIESIGQGDEAEDKPVLYFSETEKGLVLNKTNAATIAALYTPETDNWTGKKISLFATEVQYGSKMTLALRVRTKAPKAGQVNGAHLYTLEQAVAALENVGKTKDDLKPFLPTNAAGKATYVPERDSALVNKMVGDAIAAGVTAPETEL